MAHDRCLGSTSYSLGPDYHYADGALPDGLCAKCRATMIAAESAQPAERTWDFFALRRGERFAHFYPSETQVKMCGDGPIVRVRATKDADGDYFGWYNSFHPHNGSHQGHLSFVYPHRTAVEICFPYGPAAETQRGHGEIVRARVEEIPRST